MSCLYEIKTERSKQISNTVNVSNKTHKRFLYAKADRESPYQYSLAFIMFAHILGTHKSELLIVTTHHDSTHE